MPPTARTTKPRTTKPRTAPPRTATTGATTAAGVSAERPAPLAPAEPVKPGRAANASGYRQVAEALREQINAGVLPPASPLPSEVQLVAAYGVSRPTARAAVAALVSEGLVVTLHGKGSFVRRGDDRPSVTHPRGITSTSTSTGTRTGTGRGARRTGKTVGFADTDIDRDTWSEVEPAATYRTDATADLALALGLPEGAPVFVVDRLLADRAGRRMSHRSHVAFAVAVDVPALETDPFRLPGDLYGALTGAGHELAWTESVRARMPSPDDAAALRIPNGTPMLITRRTTRDTTGRILAMEETHISAEDTQLTYTIAAQTG